MTDQISAEAVMPSATPSANAQIAPFSLPEEKFFPNTLKPLKLTCELSDEDVRNLSPCVPVPVLLPDYLQEATKEFCKAFPGDVMYAMKCNPDPVMLKAIHKGGVHRFDAASIKEIRTIRSLFPQATIYYMHPVKPPEMIREAYINHGVRAFVLDSYDELNKILHITNHAPDLELFVRIAVPKGNVATDFSTKFGAKPDIAANLIAETAAHTAHTGVSFHVGTQCVDPDVYARAIDYAAGVITRSGADIYALDIGGGFPTSLDDNNPPPAMTVYGEIIAQSIARNKLQSMQLLCEVGRGLVAGAGALFVRVEGRRDDLLYLNDGTYGGMFEAGGAIGLPYPCHLIRHEEHGNDIELKPFRFAGPTCDSVDMMNGPFMLPGDIRAGDWIKIEKLGAYGEVSRTDFNGFGTVQKIIITKHAGKMRQQHIA
jgi:ornithine decarboxylase